MKSGKALHLVVLIALLLSVVPAMAVAAPSTPAAPRGPVTDSVPISRTLEPAILTGALLPEFAGVPLATLFAYAYDGTQWIPIPFQVDEANANGDYGVEDGLLDANDELVFMAMDLGVQVATNDWLADAGSQLYPRYELAVTNPLASEELGWVYLYRSLTLSPPATADYVSWDGVTQRLVAGVYVTGYDDSHAGSEVLELNGSGVDVLDRDKLRVEATCYVYGIPIPVTLTEIDLAGQVVMTPTIDGPVRAGRGSTSGSTWAYYAHSRIHLEFNVGDLEPPDPCTSVTVNAIRVSSDWRDPAASGMAPATYYDANVPAGVPLDGVPDSVPTTPVTAWRQVSGARGSSVSLSEVSLQGGTLTNYYKDDQTQDNGDTGDLRSYGDAGLRVANPAGLVSVDLLSYILDAGQPPLGEQFLDYYAQPLQVAATAQTYSGPPPLLLHLRSLAVSAVQGGRPVPYPFRVVARGAVHDLAHALAPGVTVSGEWTRPVGGPVAGTAITGPKGTYQIPLNAPDAGTYTFCITSLAKDGYVYYAPHNEMATCQSVTVAAGP